MIAMGSLNLRLGGHKNPLTVVLWSSIDLQFQPLSLNPEPTTLNRMNRADLSSGLGSNPGDLASAS